MELKVGGAETIVAQINNRAGPTDHATLELSGAALASGLVTIREVWAYGNFAAVVLQPADAGQPLVLEFGVPIGPFMTNPRAVDGPYELFKHLRETQEVVFYVTLLGKKTGKGELLLRVRDRAGTGKGKGKGRLERHEINVTP